ncbi:MAG: hypothetical protein K0R29_846 [Pseudobdellovibrio sp.]|jgi:hypothetical protein|nr:hypothetical protein [Pseudobdellovibrio sp.]
MRGIIFLFLLFLINVANAGTNNQSRFELRTAPIPLYVKWYTLDATYLYNNQWAFGPSYVSYAYDSYYGNMFGPAYYGSAYGAHVIWAVDDLFSNSWYVGSHLYYESYRSVAHGLLGNKEDRRGLRTSAVLGYRQLSGSFLTMVGLGFENYDHDIQETVSAANPDYSQYHRNFTFFHAEFKVGWVF